LNSFGKGPNTILSMLDHYLANMTVKPRRVSLFADNCGAQNKNNYTLWYLLYKSFVTKYFDEITLNFLAQGHTKFSCDRFFGLAKLELKKTDAVETVEDAQNVIAQSSIHTKVQPLRDFDTKQKLVKVLDFKTFLQQYFKKSSSEDKLFTNHFYKFTKTSPKFETRKHFDSDPEMHNLFKKNLILTNHTLNPAFIADEIKELPIIETENSRLDDLKKQEKFINIHKLPKFWSAVQPPQSNP